MAHYIDADRLRAEIERLKNHSEESKKEWIGEGYNQNAFAEDCRIKSFNKLISFIDSLRQEQPEINIPSAGSGAMGTTPPKFKLDVKPAEPEADLEKEIARYLREECSADDEPSISDIARHFYELGRKAKEDK